MLRAGVGHSIDGDPRRAASEAASGALAQAGLRQADAVICFISSAHGAAYPLIVRTIAETAQTREIAGCSASGVIASQHETEGGTCVSVLAIGGSQIKGKRLFVPDLRGNDREVGRQISAAAKPALAKDNLLCLFPDTYNLTPEPLLDSIASELPHTMVVGGGATEDGSVGETFQFCGDVVSSNSVSAMLLSGDFKIDVGVSLACQPLGPGHRVTAVEENIIIELDGRSAFEVYHEAIGPLADDLPRASAFVFLGVPLDPNAERLERGRYLVRNIIGASKEHGVLAVAHRPRVGDLVGLVLRDGQRARDDLKLALEELRASTQRPPAFGLYFDCVSRGSGLYNVPNHDSAYIRQYLGEIPVAGFFTGLEIGPLSAATRLLQYSGVLVLVSERCD